MITFPKRGNEKTHQQNGVDTFNNTTKTKYLLSKFRDYEEFLWGEIAEQLHDLSALYYISISIDRKTGSFIIWDDFLWSRSWFLPWNYNF